MNNENLDHFKHGKIDHVDILNYKVRDYESYVGQSAKVSKNDSPSDIETDVGLSQSHFSIGNFTFGRFALKRP